MKKKITHFAILLLLFFSFSIPVAAADFEASSSVGSVSPGETFSIKISTPKAGHFSITGNNATVSTNSIWCENSCSLSATAGSSGTATVSINAANVTGDDKTPAVDGKNVSVQISTLEPAKDTSDNPETVKEKVIMGLWAVPCCLLIVYVVLLFSSH